MVSRLKQDTEFETVILPLQEICDSTDVNRVAEVIARELIKFLKLEKLPIKTLEDFYLLFERGNLSKPLILILDEFDGLEPAAIAGLVGVFRNIYHRRRNQTDKPSAEKDYLLHSIALIGVRAVLGVENVKGSPFNVGGWRLP